MSGSTHVESTSVSAQTILQRYVRWIPGVFMRLCDEVMASCAE